MIITYVSCFPVWLYLCCAYVCELKKKLKNMARFSFECLWIWLLSLFVKSVLSGWLVYWFCEINNSFFFILNNRFLVESQFLTFRFQQTEFVVIYCSPLSFVYFWLLVMVCLLLSLSLSSSYSSCCGVVTYVILKIVPLLVLHKPISTLRLTSRVVTKLLDPTGSKCCYL